MQDAYSDTEKDPHTPHFFKEVFTMMMHTKDVYNGVNFPVYPKIDKIADHTATRLAFAGLYILFYINFATAWWMYLLLPIHFLIGPIQGAIVNWAGHKYGYRNFPGEKDHSKNTLFIDFLMLGELFQNNHHHAGARPNFAAKWWEIDLVYPIIKLLNKLGIIKLIPLKY